MYRPELLTVAILLILPACRSRQDAGQPDSAAAAMARTDTSTLTGADSAARSSMPGMAGGKMAGDMTESMEMRMRVMDTASSATMLARMPRYHQMADSMVARMVDDVRKMKIATDSAWTTTVDSVRQDLGRMRTMGASDMTAMMPAHLARMRFLIQMHQTMMGKTPP